MRRIILAAAALLLALTACTSTSIPSTTLTGSGGVTGGSGLSGSGSTGKAVNLVQGALVKFQACEDFLAHVKAEAIDRVGPYGLDWYGGWPIAFGRVSAPPTTSTPLAVVRVNSSMFFRVPGPADFDATVAMISPYSTGCTRLTAATMGIVA